MHQLERNPDSIDKVTIYTAHNQLEVQQANDTFYNVENYPDSAESSLSGQLNEASVDQDTDADTGAQPGDARAIHETDDSGALKAAQGLLLPGLLGLIVSMAYMSLQALRAGLLTRFVGSLGVGLGVARDLHPPAVAVASRALGRLPRLPRAAVQRPGAGWAPARLGSRRGHPVAETREEESSAPRPGGDAIEGEATEVPATGGTAEGSGGAQPGSGRRKRKRRR